MIDDTATLLQETQRLLRESWDFNSALKQSTSELKSLVKQLEQSLDAEIKKVDALEAQVSKMPVVVGYIRHQEELWLRQLNYAENFRAEKHASGEFSIPIYLAPEEQGK